MVISRRQFLRGDFAGRTMPTVEGGLATVIAASCLAYGNVVCRSCGETCEVGAIRFRPRLGGAAVPEVEGGKCTGCGACMAPCPVKAIVLA